MIYFLYWLITRIFMWGFYGALVDTHKWGPWKIDDEDYIYIGLPFMGELMWIVFFMWAATCTVHVIFRYLLSPTRSTSTDRV